MDGGGDGVPLGGVGEDEGEVALDGLEAGEIVGGDFFEREFVEGGEIELCEVDGLAEFAASGFRVWASSPKWAMGWLLRRAVAERPGWSQAGASEVKVRAAWAAGRSEEGEEGFDCAFEFEEWGRLVRCGAVVAGMVPVRPRESWGIRGRRR